MLSSPEWLNRSLPLLSSLPPISRDIPLAPLTTLGVGGSADYFCRPKTEDEVLAALVWARRESLPVFVLGGGSNLVFPDSGLRALVLQPSLTGKQISFEGDAVIAEVGAGVLWDDWVAESAVNGWVGMACLSGIPGTVGAAPIQNIGAYGQEVSQVITYVRAWDREQSELVVLQAEACRFSYRDSLFKSVFPGRYLVLAVGFRLSAKGFSKPNYPDLQNRLPQDPTPMQTREAVLKVRGEKSMVVDVQDPNSRGCGSFFMNPILDESAYEAFLQKEPGDHPCYPTGGGFRKLSAAWLIERSGFPKGLRRGRVGLSEKHCLALINLGAASAADVKTFAREIRDGVMVRFGVSLVPEPVWVSEQGLPLVPFG